MLIFIGEPFRGSKDDFIKRKGTEYSYWATAKAKDKMPPYIAANDLKLDCVIGII